MSTPPLRRAGAALALVVLGACRAVVSPGPGAPAAPDAGVRARDRSGGVPGDVRGQDARAAGEVDAPPAPPSAPASSTPSPDAPVALPIPPALPPPAVVMRGYDLQRTGANTRESTLIPANVTPGGFGKLYCRAVDDEIYGQILFIPRLDLGARGRRNVLFVVTMNDSAYAFDADETGGPPLWRMRFTDAARGITPVPASELGISTCRQYKDISRNVGIVSTPVIDQASGTLYLLARTKEPGPRYVQKLHAIALADGQERPGSPVEIAATVDGSGGGSQGGKLDFDPLKQNQRAALLLHQGVVYITWAAHCDEEPYHGWVLGYDARTLDQVVVYNATPDGDDGGIWMAGQGPSVDEDGNIYLVTGNGSADLDAPGPNRGQAMLKLRRQGGTLEVLDWFTPFNYLILENEDRDFGSSGALLIPGRKLAIGGGKEGKLYLLDRDNLGKYHPTADDQILQTVSLTGARRAHLHGTPVYWKSTEGEFVYVMAEEDYLKQFQLGATRLSLAHMSQQKAPSDPLAERYTMPGGILALSAAGATPGTGILWVTMPIALDANQAVVPGILRAFDASDVSKELWNSEQNAARDSLGNFAKFNPVTVVNGKVYVPTFSSQFCAYGLL